MRPVIFQFALTAASVLNLVTIAGEPLTGQVERKIALHSAVASIRQAIAQLEAPPGDSQIQTLANKIVGNCSEHQLTATSKHLCRLAVRDQWEADFGTRWKRILAEANVGVRPPIDTQELQALAGEAPDRLAAGATESFLRKHFDALFSDARSGAVARQRKQIEIGVQPPTQRDVDDALDADAVWENHGERFTVPMLEKALPKGVVLLEENRREVEAEVGRVLAQVGKEYQWQLADAKTSTSERNVPRSVVTAAQIVAHAHTVLRKHIQDRSRTQKTQYGVFRSVQRELQRSAAILEKHRLAAAIDNVEVAANRAFLEQEIKAKTTAHRQAGESQKVFERALRQPIATRVVQQHVAASDLPQAQADAAVLHFRELLDNDEELGRKLAERIGKLLVQPLKSVREKVAAEQVRQTFPQLADWCPSADDGTVPK